MITVLKDKVEGTFIEKNGAREETGKEEVGVERQKRWESRGGREGEREGGRGTRGQSHTYVCRL